MQEIAAGQSRFEPFRARLHRVIEIRERPSRATLKPYRFIRIKEFAVPAERRVDAAVGAVHAVLQPERNDILEEPIAVGREELRATLLQVRSHGTGCSHNLGQVNAGPQRGWTARCRTLPSASKKRITSSSRPKSKAVKPA